MGAIRVNIFKILWLLVLVGPTSSQTLRISEKLKLHQKTCTLSENSVGHGSSSFVTGPERDTRTLLNYFTTTAPHACSASSMLKNGQTVVGKECYFMLTGMVTRVKVNLR
jgi:hypothetical protein